MASQVESTIARSEVSYDPSCYMCPGNKRSTGQANPVYQTVFVFDNDFPALLPQGESGRINESICCSPRPKQESAEFYVFPKHHSRSP